jgi:hypothetical protein
MKTKEGIINDNTAKQLYQNCTTFWADVTIGRPVVEPNLVQPETNKKNYSIHSLPTSRTNCLPSNPPSLWPTQPRHDLRELLRSPHAMLQRRVRTYRIHQPRNLPLSLPQQLTLNRSRSNAIHRRPIPSQLVRQVSGDGFESGLARRVNGQTFEELPRRDRGNVDYPRGFLEVGRGSLDHEKGGLQVCGED